MNYSAAIFDLDGTLIESNSIWEKLDRIFLDRRNINYTDDFIKTLTAMTYEDAAEAMINMGIETSVQEFTEEINRLAVYEYSNNIFLKDGAADYLAYLKKNNIKIALATASPAELYIPVLKNNRIFDYFDAFTTTDEVGLSKDHPDIYLKTAEKLAVPPCECIVFEDVLKGVVSAKKAGMMAVGVYDEYSADYTDEIIKTADKFISSFTEML